MLKAIRRSVGLKNLTHSLTLGDTMVFGPDGGKRDPRCLQRTT